MRTKVSDVSEDSREIPLTWIGIEDVPILTINQMVGQALTRQEYIVTLGQVAPPVLLGTEEQRRQQMEMLTFAAVKPVARIGLTRRRVEELIRILTEILDNADKMDEGNDD